MKIKQTILVFALIIGITSFVVAPIASAKTCGGTETSVIDCEDDDGIIGLLKMVFDILTAGVGVAAVGGIIYASILYASAGDSSEQTKKSISVIVNVAVGLIAYALMYVFMRFLIPGWVPFK